ncbi:MAG: hypothetical protein QOH65_1932, partial [Methylobacteriaceae bacterium]|nr:hypothetical protein [Methylobacteriaceae bacterium]
MSAKPIIFISYAHADEPEKPSEGEVRWLSFVRTYLQPAVKDGVFDLWVDRQMMGGADWDPEIEQKLRACDICILLVSASSMASNYIIDKEIAIIRERQAKGENVYFYPLLLTPTPDAGLAKVKDKNLRPRDAKPFSGFSLHDRMQHMTEAANEIARIAEQVVKRKSVSQPAIGSAPLRRSANIDLTGLPETPYERLVGREGELKCLDEAWADSKTNIVSLIAEGGAGKSALVNEWLKLLQAENYRGAKPVLGWSFYSQGSKERATAADEFLDWALKKLDIKIETTSASTKGDAIAEKMMQHRVLLVLDGVEPLQHGLDAQLGQLKDQGLRSLLRRFAAAPPAQAHGLIVLTSRLAVTDIARWKDGAAPVLDVEKLSDDAGAALLRDNAVWGTTNELKAAAHEFGGHPLALGLLASFLKETQTGDVRRRDHIREFFADTDNPRHDHARRVMESYENEWLAKQPVLLAIMHMVGLFDRPANRRILFALRRPPIIKGLTDEIANLDDKQWQRAVARLRDVRLLSPKDPSASDDLDAHPLVREWFGDRLKQRNELAWQAAHGRLYEHLRDTTKEGKSPTVNDLTPLYHAIGHGCRAARYRETLDDVYVGRICRRRADGRIEFYARSRRGAFGSDLAAISWFFERSYDKPVAALSAEDRGWVLSDAGSTLLAQGRIHEALLASRVALRASIEQKSWESSASRASNVSQFELLVGTVAAAVLTAEQAVSYADRSADVFLTIGNRGVLANALHAAGQGELAERILMEAEQRQQKRSPTYPLLPSVLSYVYCDLLLSRGRHVDALARAATTIEWQKQQGWLLDIALDTVSLGRAHLALAINDKSDVPSSSTGKNL